MKQKYQIGTRVHITKNMPLHMKHFDCDFIGIVAGTYNQLCMHQKDGHLDYSIIVLDKNDKPVNCISWYHEDQLTKVPSKMSKNKRIYFNWIEKDD